MAAPATPAAFTFKVVNNFPEAIYLPFQLLGGNYTYNGYNQRGEHIPVNGYMILKVNADGSMNINGNTLTVTDSTTNDPIPFTAASTIPFATPYGLYNAGVNTNGLTPSLNVGSPNPNGLPDWTVQLSAGGEVSLSIANIIVKDWQTLYPTLKAAGIYNGSNSSDASLTLSASVPKSIQLTCTPNTTSKLSKTNYTFPFHFDLYKIVKGSPATYVYKTSTQNFSSVEAYPGDIFLGVNPVTNEVLFTMGVTLTYNSGYFYPTLSFSDYEYADFETERLQISKVNYPGAVSGLVGTGGDDYIEFSPIGVNSESTNVRLFTYDEPDYVGNMLICPLSSDGDYDPVDSNANNSTTSSYRQILDYQGVASTFKKIDKNVEIINQLPLDVDVYWVNNEGGEEHINHIAAGQTCTINSYVNQLIVVRLAKASKVLHSFYTSSYYPSVTISNEMLWRPAAPGAEKVTATFTIPMATSKAWAVYTVTDGDVGSLKASAYTITDNGNYSWTAKDVPMGTILALCSDESYTMPIAYAIVNADGTADTVLTYRTTMRSNGQLYEGEVAIFPETGDGNTVLVLNSHMAVVGKPGTFSQFQWNNNMVQLPYTIGEVKVGPNTQVTITDSSVYPAKSSTYVNTQSDIGVNGLQAEITITRVEAPSEAKMRVYNAFSEDFKDPTPGVAAASGAAPLTKHSVYRTTMIFDPAMIAATNAYAKKENNAQYDFQVLLSTEAVGGTTITVSEGTARTSYTEENYDNAAQLQTLTVEQGKTVTLTPNKAGRIVVTQEAVRKNTAQEAAELKGISPPPPKGGALGAPDATDTTVKLISFNSNNGQIVVSDNSAFSTNGGTAQYIMTDGTSQPFTYSGTAAGNVVTNIVNCPTITDIDHILLHQDNGQLWAPTLMVHHNGLDPVKKTPYLQQDNWVVIYPDADLHTKMTTKLGSATAPISGALAGGQKTEVTYALNKQSNLQATPKKINIVPEGITGQSNGTSLCDQAQQALMSTVSTIKHSAHESAGGVQSHVMYEAANMPDSAWIFGQNHFASDVTPPVAIKEGNYYQALSADDLTALSKFYGTCGEVYTWDGSSANCWHAFTHAVSDAFHVVVQGIDDAAHWVAKAAESVWDDVKKAVAVSIHWVENEVTKVVHFVVDAVEKVAALCKAIFTAIETAVEDVIKFLEFLFDFEAIWHTAEFFKNTVNGFLNTDTSTPGLGQMLSVAQSGADTFIDNLKSSADTELQSIFHNSPNTSNSPTLPTQNEVLEKLEWILGKIISFLESEAGDTKTSALTTDVTKLVTDMQSTFGAALSELSPSDLGITTMESIIGAISGGWQAALAPIGTWLQKIVDDLLDGAKDLVDDLIQLVKDAINGIVSFLGTSILDSLGFLGKLLNMVFSWLGISSAFSWENIISLILAVPTTIGFKFKYDKDPFTGSGGKVSFPNISQGASGGITTSSNTNYSEEIEIYFLSMFKTLLEPIKVAGTIPTFSQYTEGVKTPPTDIGWALSFASFALEVALTADYFLKTEYTAEDFSPSSASSANLCNQINKYTTLSSAVVSALNLALMYAGKTAPDSVDWRKTSLVCTGTMGIFGTVASLILMYENPDPTNATQGNLYNTAGLMDSLGSIFYFAETDQKGDPYGSAVVFVITAAFRTAAFGCYIGAFVETLTEKN